MAFAGVDYLDFESLLTEEQRLVRDTVRGWVEEKVLPIIEEAAWEGRFPKELIPEMAGMSLFGSTLSDYGLPGLDNIAYGLIMQELERGDSGLRSFVSVQSASSCTRSTPSVRPRRRTAGSRLSPAARRSAASG
jgi:glutaryl-CoA dehydrogenase